MRSRAAFPKSNASTAAWQTGSDTLTPAFRSTSERAAKGQGKWTLLKLIDLATTATVSFTSAPLRIVTILGLLTLVFGFVVAAESLIGWFQGRAVSGFTTTIITLLIVGSFIMISLGIIGEYIAKIYDEIKARPSYLVESMVGIEDDVGPRVELTRPRMRVRIDGQADP